MMRILAVCTFDNSGLSHFHNVPDLYHLHILWKYIVDLLRAIHEACRDKYSLPISLRYSELGVWGLLII